MNKGFRIIIVFAVIVGILVVGKNFIAKFAVEKGVYAATGLPLKIKKFNVGLITTNIGIRDLNLFNPKGFPKEVMFHAPEIFVDYDLGAFIRGKIHLEDIRLDFDQFVIVKNKEGKTNIEVLKPKKAEEKPKKEKGKKMPDIQIDHLLVKVGKIVYKDYSGEGEPSVKEFKVNLSEEFNDVTNKNMNWVILVVANKAIMKTTLSSLAGFNMDVFKGVSEVSEKAVETLKGTAETLKGTAETLKEKLKLPFGGNK